MYYADGLAKQSISAFCIRRGSLRVVILAEDLDDIKSFVQLLCLGDCMRMMRMMMMRILTSSLLDHLCITS
eukprot:7896114-Heterocapsa_arctica.AAC.1